MLFVSTAFGHWSTKTAAADQSSRGSGSSARRIVAGHQQLATVGTQRKRLSSAETVRHTYSSIFTPLMHITECILSQLMSGDTLLFNLHFAPTKAQAQAANGDSQSPFNINKSQIQSSKFWDQYPGFVFGDQWEAISSVPVPLNKLALQSLYLS